MKRVFLTSTYLVAIGGMAAADVSVSGSAELGVKGSKSSDVQFHRDIQVAFGLSGATDTGLSFGATAKVHEAEASRFEKQSVHLTGAFGTLTLGDTDGAFDAALEEVGAGGAIADDHTGHKGYNGNPGLDGTVNAANVLRYDYSLGGITTSVSGEFDADDAKRWVPMMGAAHGPDDKAKAMSAWRGETEAKIRDGLDGLAEEDRVRVVHINPFGEQLRAAGALHFRSWQIDLAGGVNVARCAGYQRASNSIPGRSMPNSCTNGILTWSCSLRSRPTWSRTWSMTTRRCPVSAQSWNAGSTGSRSAPSVGTHLRPKARRAGCGFPNSRIPSVSAGISRRKSGTRTNFLSITLRVKGRLKESREPKQTPDPKGMRYERFLDH